MNPIPIAGEAARLGVGGGSRQNGLRVSKRPVCGSQVEVQV